MASSSMKIEKLCIHFEHTMYYSDYVVYSFRALKSHSEELLLYKIRACLLR